MWRRRGIGGLLLLACVTACGGSGGGPAATPTSASSAPSTASRGPGSTFNFLNRVSSACLEANMEFASDGPQVSDLLTHPNRYRGRGRAAALEAMRDFARAGHTLARTLLRLRAPERLRTGYHRFASAVAAVMAQRDVLYRDVRWRVYDGEGSPPVSARHIQQALIALRRAALVAHRFAAHHDLSQCDTAPQSPLNA